MLRRYIALSLTVCTLSLGAHEALSQALVVNNEEIADAKLFAAAKAEKRVNLFGARPSESIEPVIDGFKKATGIDVEYIRLPSVKMYDRVLAEFAAGKLEADYADLTDLTLIKEWVSRGILAPHKVPWHDRIAHEIKDAEGRWYYIARPFFVIAVNTAEVNEKDYPKSWRDTFDPKWKGKVGMQGMEAGGSGVTLHTFLRMQLGEDAWPKLAANSPRIYATVAPVVNDLVRGRIPVGYVDASSAATQIQEKAPIKMIFPSEGVIGYGVFGGVTAKAQHPNAAKLWMNYVTSKQGSTAMSRSGAYGTHPDALAPVIPGYTLPKQDAVWSVEPDQWDKVREKWLEDWKVIFAKSRAEGAKE